MEFTQAELTAQELQNLPALAKLARGAILKMTTLAASGHPGGSMSTIDFLLMLLNLANIDPEKPKWPERDRIIVSHGHVSPAVYAALALKGYFDLDQAIAGFRLAGSRYEGHIEPEVPGVEWASGNLGQGLSAACGVALGCRQKGIDNHVFVLMGDGEQQKGQLGEARRFAVKYKLNNLIGFIDLNGLQISGQTCQVMPQNISANYQADGWKVLNIDGHDFSEIQNAILKAVSAQIPTVIIGRTTMGKGVSFMENQEKFHGSALNIDQLEIALKELGLDNDLEKYRILRKKFHPEPNRHDSPLSFNLNIGKPRIYRDKTDNRSAWGNALTDLANANQNIPFAVFDCDLSGSVKTSGFAAVRPDSFYQSGISEHHTAVAAGAMSKEIPHVFFSDFGVFGISETYNQHRLNDINHTNLKLITTHVGLDVGEDGKTHQCIDYLGLFSNLFHFRVIIPADPNQTDKVIRFISTRKGNFLVPLGRSKLEIIEDSSGEPFFADDYSFEYGQADLFKDGSDAALLTMGTLAGKALAIARELETEDIHLQVWNLSCPLALDKNAILQAASTGTIFTYEDHNVNTGIGSLVAQKMVELGINCRLVKFGVSDYAGSGRSEDVFKGAKLDFDHIKNTIIDNLKKK